MVWFTALGRVARPSGAALIKKGLYFGFRRNGDAGRATINDAANGGPVAFSPGGHAKKVAKAIVRHEEIILCFCAIELHTFMWNSSGDVRLQLVIPAQAGIHIP